MAALRNINGTVTHTYRDVTIFFCFFKSLLTKVFKHTFGSLKNCTSLTQSLLTYSLFPGHGWYSSIFRSHWEPSCPYITQQQKGKKKVLTKITTKKVWPSNFQKLVFIYTALKQTNKYQSSFPKSGNIQNCPVLARCSKKCQRYKPRIATHIYIHYTSSFPTPQ